MEKIPHSSDTNLFFRTIDRILTSQRLGRVADRVSELLFGPVSADPSAPRVDGPEIPTDLEHYNSTKSRDFTGRPSNKD